MALYFPEEFIQEVTEKNDIISVISQYVNLKRSGSTLKGLCPFHKEKTPSFSVSADKQLYYCFGCGKGGTVINFVMQMEHLDFVEAVTYLAEKAGIPLPEPSGTAGRSRSEARQISYKINAETGRFFYDNLMAPQGKAALEYAFRRGLTQGTINRFGLGYAPEGNRLYPYLKEKGYTDEQLIASGVVGKSDNGRIYDRFRNRLMFPIIDVRKNIIGFGGRVMDDGMPKYLNSPETVTFSKSYNLFGLNFAKSAKEDYFILVEGYMDVIALHQQGVTSAIATLGTALTPEQARIIKRMKHEVIIAYDSDEAGQKATRRAIELLTDQGLLVRVLTMPGSKDPDEYVKQNGIGAFRDLIAKSQVQIEYKINKLKEQYDTSDPKQKVDYINQAAAEFANLKSPVEREIYVKQLADETGVSADSIFSEISRLQAMRQKQKQIAEFKGRPSERKQPYEDAKQHRVREAQSLLLNLMCYHPQIADDLLPSLEEEDFSEGVPRQLFGLIKQARSGGQVPDARILVSQLADGEAAEILHDDKNVEDCRLAASQAVTIVLNNRKQQQLLEALQSDALPQQERLQKLQQMLDSKQKGGAQ